MEMEIVVKEKDVIEIEFSEKEIAGALLAVLSEMGVDAYTFDPHPLMPGFRLHLESANAMADLQKATAKLDKEWAELSKTLIAKL